MKISLDFETYSEEDLAKRGVVSYVGHGSFETLMTALALDDAPVMWWKGIPVSLLKLLSYFDGATWHAFNAPFEIRVLGKYGIMVPLHRWRCTMAHAYSRGFAGSMAQVGEAIGLPQEQRKLETGRKLIQRFCKPAPKNHKLRRYTEETSPEEWAQFREYNMQDVVTERAIARYLSRWPMTDRELEDWRMDQRINNRGIPVDVPTTIAAKNHSSIWVEQYEKEAREITGDVGPRQVKKLLDWAKEQGYGKDDLRAETIDEFLGEQNAKEQKA